VVFVLAGQTSALHYEAVGRTVFHPAFVFVCYPVGRALHSFPTRRSSDLLRRGWSLSHCNTSKPLKPGRCGSSNSSVSSGCEVLRSEEHTSELQSHLNLVCRRLLEKKKGTTCSTKSSNWPSSPGPCSTKPS